MKNNQQYLGDLKAELNKYGDKLSEVRKSFKEGSSEDVDNITKSLGKIFQEAKKAYEKLESASADEWEPLKEATSQAFEKLKNSFEESLSDSASKVKDYAHECVVCSEEKIELMSEYIKHHPLQSTLLALALGIIVGRTLK